MHLSSSSGGGADAVEEYPSKSVSLRPDKPRTDCEIYWPKQPEILNVDHGNTFETRNGREWDKMHMSKVISLFHRQLHFPKCGSCGDHGNL